MVFYWKKLQDGHGDYRVLLRIKDKDKIVYEKLRTLGSVVYPVSAWHGGEFIKERYNYVIPQLNQGRYILEVRILSQFDKTMQSGGVLEKAMKVSPS